MLFKIYNSNLYVILQQAYEVDDSELVNNYDKQYEKVKKKAKAKLPPIDSMSELSFNEKVFININIY